MRTHMVEQSAARESAMYPPPHMTHMYPSPHMVRISL